jgi:hypothetical protein
LVVPAKWGPHGERRTTRISRGFSHLKSLRYYLVAKSNKPSWCVMETGPNSVESFLQDFRETILSATEHLRALEARTNSSSHPAEQWTAKEILGHLIDSAANNHQRFIRAQSMEELVFPGYEQNSWVELQNYNDESWLDLIQLWSLYNLHLIHVVTQIPQNVLTKPRKTHNLDQIAWKAVDSNQPVTLLYFVRDYLGHLKHHLNQIYDRTDSSGC